MLSEYPFFSNFYGRSDAKKAHGSDLDAFFAYFFVNTILELCKPRESIFQSNYTDDVISITNLTNGKISGSAFFEETYLTDGMKRLFDTAFRRFNGEDVTPIVRLKQAMGGVKSHNMVALIILIRKMASRMLSFFSKKTKNNEHAADLRSAACSFIAWALLTSRVLV